VSLSCYFYQFTNSSWRRSIARNPVLRTARMATILKRHRIPSVDVLLAVKRRQTLNWNSYLLTREIENVKELDAKGDHVYRIHPTISLTPELALAFGRHLARVHNLGFFHGDLKSRHILIEQDRLNQYTFYLVDIEKSTFVPFLPPPLSDLFASRDLIQFQDSTRATGRSALKIFFESYNTARDLPAFRLRFIESAVSLYGPNGRFRQGRTVLANLWQLLREHRNRW
jgi:tRNA A-37 threonylcarbamoyl transferase component Bud32